MKSILSHPVKTELCSLAQCNAPVGVYEHSWGRRPSQLSCWTTRTFFALITRIATTVHLGQSQNLLPKSCVGGDKTRCCWTHTSSHVDQLHQVAGKHLADLLHEHHLYVTGASNMGCFTRNRRYSHPTTEGIWSMSKARVAGGKTARGPEQLGQGHGWGLSSPWREALLSRVTKQRDKEEPTAKQKIPSDSSFLSSASSAGSRSNENVARFSLF